MPANNHKQRFVKVCVQKQGTTTTHFRNASPPLVNPGVVALLHTGSDFNVPNNNSNNARHKLVVNKYAK